ncbi:ABC transporter permease [Granulicella arctica]|uniref:ABC transporter permease n=1 Tax=Granulicella arctica TaxID=940613 RepID=UPI0021DFAE66|nr:ABC transporter permease [Granulicella arctica]
MQTILQDFRFALRQLRRAPALALTAVLTLALGIGANTAIFSLLDQALLRSLPVRDPQQLVVLEGTGKAWQGHTSSHGGDADAYFSYPMYRDLREQNRAFQGLIATSPAGLDVTWQGSAQFADGEVVSGDYFSVLGARAYEGRLLSAADDTAPGANPVAVLSFDFWQSHLGSASGLIGKSLSLNGYPFEVIGIAAPGFHSAVWGQTPGVFVPMSMLEQVIPGQGRRLTNHKDRWMNILGRLRDGESMAQAQTSVAPLWYALRADELKALGHQSPHFVADFLTNSRLRVLPGARGFSYSRDALQKPLLVVMGMAILVLLISSVNVASLLLVRSAGRVREFSLRTALGASDRRMMGQLVLEGLLIGVLGGGAGLLLAPAALRVLVHSLSEADGTSIFSAALDGRVLLFNFGIALLVSLCFSMAPALQLRRLNLTTALRESSSTGSGGMLVLRRMIVCLQIGLSVLLLVGAGLFVRTMQKLRAVDVGFNTGHVLSFNIHPNLAGYSAMKMPALQQRIADSLGAIPGVEGVAATDDPLLSGSTQGGNISVDGYTPATDDEMDVEKSAVNPAYFLTMQIPLLAGRQFNVSDNAAGPKVAVVNESFARRYFGRAQNALGHRLMDGASSKPVFDTEIVGVVRDSKHSGIRDQPEPTLYMPFDQSLSHAVRETYFYVRTAGASANSVTAVRHAMQQVDADLAVDEMNTMDQLIDEVLRDDRTVTLLAVSFGVLATVLAGIGLYGVLAYATTQRTREIGIRMALGAQRLVVMRLVVGDMAKVAGVAVLIALPVAVGLSRLLRSQLFGVSSSDPATLVGCLAVTAVMVLIASAVPALRAAKVEPTEALRIE